jgi:hypothetical protein
MMGVFNNRIPEFDSKTGTYRWEHNREALGASVSVTHTGGEESIELEFVGDKLEIPVVQAKWLAEVLLQLTDHYREDYKGGGHDEYNRPGVDARDRR